MKRNEKVGIIIGLALVATFLVIDKIYPQAADVIPGYVLMPSAIAATIFIAWQQKRRAQGQTKLIFGWFTLPRLLLITMGVPIALAIVAIVITKITQPDSPPVKLFALAGLGFAFALAGFFFSMGRYIWTNRDR